MTIAQLPPIPLRIRQGFALTSLTHDQIHQDMAGSLALVVDALNSLVLSNGNLPAGISFAYTANTLPAGRFLWEDGSAVSRITYATLNALFAADGYPWGAGNGTTTFNLPSPQGRSRIYANPLNVISANTPTLSARVLGTKYGAESYTNALVAVSGNTPSIGISFSNMGSVSFPTIVLPTQSADGTFQTLVPNTLQTLPTLVGAFPTWTAGSNGAVPLLVGAFPTWTAGSNGTVPTFPTIGVIGTAGSLGDIALTITAPTAVKGNDTGTITVVIPTITGTVNSANIAAKLTITSTGGSVGAISTVPTLVGAFPTWTAGSNGAVPTLVGTFPTWTAGGGGAAASMSGINKFPTFNVGSQTSGTNTVSGAAASAPSTALSGVTASIVVPTITPSSCYNSIITF